MVLTTSEAVGAPAQAHALNEVHYARQKSLIDLTPALLRRCLAAFQLRPGIRISACINISFFVAGRVAALPATEHPVIPSKLQPAGCVPIFTWTIEPNLSVKGTSARAASLLKTLDTQM